METTKKNICKEFTRLYLRMASETSFFVAALLQKIPLYNFKTFKTFLAHNQTSIITSITRQTTQSELLSKYVP